jgi:hypothetical protein
VFIIVKERSEADTPEAEGVKVPIVSRGDSHAQG